MYTEYLEDFVSEKAFEKEYQQIKTFVTAGRIPNSDKCTIILGGQPGSGKSTFYQIREDLENYIVIDGDEFRRFHPNYKNIVRTDIEHYAERTQSFCNKIVEKLISELSQMGYNLVIEGTLRNPNVPIYTCNELKKRGYHPELVVIACDAEVAWKSTIKRAYEQMRIGVTARLVPIDVYDYTVKHISENLSIIEKENCFHSISIIDRVGEKIYPENGMTASDVLSTILNLENWNKKLSIFEKEYIEIKLDFLHMQLEASYSIGDRNE